MDLSRLEDIADSLNRIAGALEERNKWDRQCFAPNCTKQVGRATELDPDSQYCAFHQQKLAFLAQINSKPEDQISMDMVRDASRVEEELGL